MATRYHPRPPRRSVAGIFLLAVVGASLCASAATRSYTVKRNDTMTDLARKNGLKVGEIAIGHRWSAQLDGGHLASEALNKKAIGICLVGNFDQDRPTRKQLESLHALVECLLARCRLSPDAVRTHQQINPIYTRCPGRNFPLQSFLKGLKEENGYEPGEKAAR